MSVITPLNYIHQNFQCDESFESKVVVSHLELFKKLEKDIAVKTENGSDDGYGFMQSDVSFVM